MRIDTRERRFDVMWVDLVLDSSRILQYNMCRNYVYLCTLVEMCCDIF